MYNRPPLGGLFCLDEVEDVLYGPYTAHPTCLGSGVPWDEVECPTVDGDTLLVARRATDILEIK